MHMHMHTRTGQQEVGDDEEEERDEECLRMHIYTIMDMRVLMHMAAKRRKRGREDKMIAR